MQWIAHGDAGRRWAHKYWVLAVLAPTSHACMQAVASECGISAMPTFQVWQDGKKVDEIVGAAKDKLVELINKYTSDAKSDVASL